MPLQLTDPSSLPAGALSVLQFWLGDVPLRDASALDKRQLWFTQSDAVDAEIRHQFADLVNQAKAGELDAWAQSPEGTLALLILLDQFTRNIGRGTPDSFAGDAKALALAKLAIAQGGDSRVPPVARIFFYLPLEHAEDLACQDAAVAAFAQLTRQGDAASQGFLDMTHDYALRHRAVIAEFGRFPHRNAILGRASTPAEQAYLAQPGAGF
ncbi:hypothetical protein CCO03_10675 [Comamonas serinivorans]|uniref:DUF924 domain-containing protein n=1 Tax=Comamonas serinivorans TaxID=1082851 RepID=A0A1Y0ETZ6_9BURK|nr:hypothetical protein CCO03_10675 [Comamonas serinivorans]